MTPSSRKSLDSIVLDLEKCLSIRKSVLLEGIKWKIQRVLEEEKPTTNGQITPCERVSYEKCLDRLDDEIKRLKGQVSHDAWGPKYTGEQSIYMKELKSKRKELVGKLGLPI